MESEQSPEQDEGSTLWLVYVNAMLMLLFLMFKYSDKILAFLSAMMQPLKEIKAKCLNLIQKPSLEQSHCAKIKKEQFHDFKFTEKQI